MEETGIVRFTGSLDPRAQEFIPRYPNDPTRTHLIPLFAQPQQPQLYSPYNSLRLAPPPPPPPPLLYHQQLSDLPFCPQYSMPPAYVGNGGISFTNFMPPSTAPTRTLVLSSVPSDVSESTVRRELEVFGEVRGVQMEGLLDGILTVHFYDLRHARTVLSEIQQQHMHHQNWLMSHYYSNLVPPPPPPPPRGGLILGHRVWAQFTVPASNGVPDGSNNQGTIVVFNLDPEVTTASLKKIFGAFGEVKEVRETPLKRRQRFVEFFDIRDAARALEQMNGKDIHGQCVVIEFSRPGGFSKKFFNATKFYGPTISNSMFTLHPPPPPPPVPLSHESSGRFPQNIYPRQSFPKNSSHHRNVNPSVLEVVDKVVNDGSSKKSGKKIVEKSNSTAGRNRPWKGRHGKKFDVRFLINEEAITESNCKDSRTTVMIKNIPNKYR